MEIVTALSVDFEGELAKVVASGISTGLSRAALRAGESRVKSTVLWESLQEPQEDREQNPDLRVFILEQNRPDAVDALAGAVGEGEGCLYGLVVAVPQQRSPLAGALLYRAVEHLKEAGVRPGRIEPALLHGLPVECERYCGRLLERIGERSGRR